MRTTKKLLLPVLTAILVHSLGRASQTEQHHPNIIAVFDPALEKRTAHDAAAALFAAVAEHEQDITVRTIDGGTLSGWSPLRRLSLSDFKTQGLTAVFLGVSANQTATERKSRVAAALREFDEHSVSGSPIITACVGPAKIAKQVGSSTSQLNVLFLGRPICTSPRTTVELPAQSRMAVFDLQHGAPTDECQATANAQHIVQSFPQAYITPALDTDVLEDILSDGTNSSSRAQITVQGCNGRPVMTARASPTRHPSPDQKNAPAWTILPGKIGASATWKSGWIDLTNPTNFAKGDRLRMRVGGTALKVVVRLLQRGSDPDASGGVLPDVYSIRPEQDRTIDVVVPDDTPQVVQISLHGGPNPFNEIPLGSGNGAATLLSVERVR